MRLQCIGTSVVLLTVMTTSALATTEIQDNFGSATLNPNWLLNDDPSSYAPDGGFALDPTHNLADFSDVGNNAYANLRWASTFDTTQPMRVDAIMGQFSPINYLQTWGMSVAIYYDANDWVALRETDAGGSYGWMAQTMVGGSLSQGFSNAQPGMINNYYMAGIQLTSSQIQFWGSPLTSPTVNEKDQGANIDANTSIVPELTVNRPAAFTGQAWVIIGKGITDAAINRPDPFFNNSYPIDNYGLCAINYARILATGNLPGDVNGDGVVNGLDISSVSSHWLQSGTGPVIGDANSDGVVNGLDIALISSNWLHTGGAAGGGAAVPEPSTMALAALGLCIACVYGVRRSLGCSADRPCGWAKVEPAPPVSIFRQGLDNSCRESWLGPYLLSV
jgi:hypothetical protein